MNSEVLHAKMSIKLTSNAISKFNTDFKARAENLLTCIDTISNGERTVKTGLQNNICRSYYQKSSVLFFPLRQCTTVRTCIWLWLLTNRLTQWNGDHTCVINEPQKSCAQCKQKHQQWFSGWPCSGCRSTSSPSGTPRSPLATTGLTSSPPLHWNPSGKQCWSSAVLSVFVFFFFSFFGFFSFFSFSFFTFLSFLGFGGGGAAQQPQNDARTVNTKSIAIWEKRWCYMTAASVNMMF